MRIGMIAGEYPPMQGGVGAYTRILARALADLGHELFLYTRHNAVEADTRLHLTPQARSWGAGTGRGVRRWSCEQRLALISLQYQTAAFDMSPWVHALPHAVDVPLVTTFHDLRFPYLFPKAGRLRSWIVDHLARASSGVIATNPEDHAHLALLNRAALIPIGSNILAQPPGDMGRDIIRQRLGETPGEFRVGHFGLVNASKGLDLLLDAIASLRADGVPARLLVIGGTAGSSDPTNADYLRNMETKIERLGLQSAIDWTGYLDEAGVSAYLAACDAVALPFYDGASTRRGSLMAAIQCGCAIVTTTPRAPTPLFAHEENMLLVPPNAAALAAALRRLHDAPILAARLRGGAKALSAQFEWPQIARQTAAFFAQTLESGRP